jgi:hypothetical protein
MEQDLKVESRTREGEREIAPKKGRAREKRRAYERSRFKETRSAESE